MTEKINPARRPILVLRLSPFNCRSSHFCAGYGKSCWW